MKYENYLFKMLENQSNRMGSTNDPADHVSMDIPLLIRLFELVREDVKTDVDLHFVVEKIIALKNKGTLSMDDYTEIASGNRSGDSGQEPKMDPELESIRKLAGI